MATTDEQVNLNVEHTAIQKSNNDGLSTKVGDVPFIVPTVGNVVAYFSTHNNVGKCVGKKNIDSSYILRDLLCADDFNKLKMFRGNWEVGTNGRLATLTSREFEQSVHDAIVKYSVAMINKDINNTDNASYVNQGIYAVLDALMFMEIIEMEIGYEGIFTNQNIQTQSISEVKNVQVDYTHTMNVRAINRDLPSTSTMPNNGDEHITVQVSNYVERASIHMIMQDKLVLQIKSSNHKTLSFNDQIQELKLIYDDLYTETTALRELLEPSPSSIQICESVLNNTYSGQKYVCTQILETMNRITCNYNNDEWLVLMTKDQKSTYGDYVEKERNTKKVCAELFIDIGRYVVDSAKNINKYVMQNKDSINVQEMREFLTNLIMIMVSLDITRAKFVTRSIGYNGNYNVIKQFLNKEDQGILNAKLMLKVRCFIKTPEQVKLWQQYNQNSVPIDDSSILPTIADVQVHVMPKAPGEKVGSYNQLNANITGHDMIKLKNTCRDALDNAMLNTKHIALVSQNILIYINTESEIDNRALMVDEQLRIYELGISDLDTNRIGAGMNTPEGRSAQINVNMWVLGMLRNVAKVKPNDNITDHEFSFNEVLLAVMHAIRMFSNEAVVQHIGLGGSHLHNRHAREYNVDTLEVTGLGTIRNTEIEAKQLLIDETESTFFMNTKLVNIHGQWKIVKVNKTLDTIVNTFWWLIEHRIRITSLTVSPITIGWEYVVVKKKFRSGINMLKYHLIMQRHPLEDTMLQYMITNILPDISPEKASKIRSRIEAYLATGTDIIFEVQGTHHCWTNLYPDYTRRKEYQGQINLTDKPYMSYTANMGHSVQIKDMYIMTQNRMDNADTLRYTKAAIIDTTELQNKDKIKCIKLIGFPGSQWNEIKQHFEDGSVHIEPICDSNMIDKCTALGIIYPDSNISLTLGTTKT